MSSRKGKTLQMMMSTPQLIRQLCLSKSVRDLTTPQLDSLMVDSSSIFMDQINSSKRDKTSNLSYLSSVEYIVFSCLFRSTNPFQASGKFAVSFLTLYFHFSKPTHLMRSARTGCSHRLIIMSDSGISSILSIK